MHLTCWSEINADSSEEGDDLGNSNHSNTSIVDVNDKRIGGGGNSFLILITFLEEKRVFIQEKGSFLLVAFKDVFNRGHFSNFSILQNLFSKTLVKEIKFCTKAHNIIVFQGYFCFDFAEGMRVRTYA